MGVLTNPPIFLQGSTDELVVYLCGGYYQGAIIAGPTAAGSVIGPTWMEAFDFIDSRDLELCKRINAQLKHSVYALSYRIGSSYNNVLGFYKPYNWIQKAIYDYARSKGFKKVHLIGFSAGGCAISSQFLYYQDSLVQDLIIISGWTANNPKAVHTNAAYYSLNIKVPALLIYGKQDSFRPDGDVWLQNNNTAKLVEYDGGHDYGPFIDLVTSEIVKFMGSTPTPSGRKIHLAIQIAGGPAVPVTLIEGVKQSMQIDVTGTIEG